MQIFIANPDQEVTTDCVIIIDIYILYNSNNACLQKCQRGVLYGR